MIEHSIEQRLSRVRAKMASACATAHRSVDSVKLIAVSKNKPISLIDEAVTAGQIRFGENYVQEALEKFEARSAIEWHFIGSLQSNKAKQVVGKFALVHSVDRWKLAQALDLAAKAAGVRQSVLLQIRIGNEATKHGFSIDEMPQMMSEVSSLTHLSIRGLMALPPLEDDESKARAHFVHLRRCLEEWRSLLPMQNREAFCELSIGTSSDYEAAILEGATLVRVGTEIFGARS